MGHDIYFDTARGRVGFAESDCDYTRLVSEVGSISSPGHVSTAKTEVSPAEGEEGVESEESVEPTDVEEEEINSEVEEIMEEAQELQEEIAQEISTPELPIPEGDPEMGEGAKNGDVIIPVPSPPLPPEYDGEEDEVDPNSYQLFNGDESPVQTHKKFGAGGGDVKGMAAEILDDMKHECSSDGCRLVAALSILAASVVVILLVRRTVARRRVVRQYQEAELEISDLALDSDDDDEHEGYVDEPPQIT